MLGPVEIAWDGRPVDIGGVKARALVARLLIDRHIIVSVDRLVDSLWGDNDGTGAEIALRSTISRLRKRLREAGAPDDLIVTRAPGYVLEVPAEVTDALRLERLVAEGRRQLARRRPSECVRLLAEAEGLWRGPAYSEVRDEPFARAEARRLEELLLPATETRMDAELDAGPARGGHRRAGNADERQPHARAAVVAAHAGALPLRAARRRRCGCSRTCGPSWWPSWGSSRGTT